MSQRVDYGRGAHAYRQARSLPPEVLAPWATAVRSLGITSRRLLDVGAGPGGFLEPVAEWLGATTTVAVEPSAVMRGEAAAAGLTSRFP